MRLKFLIQKSVTKKLPKPNRSEPNPNEYLNVLNSLVIIANIIKNIILNI